MTEVCAVCKAYLKLPSCRADEAFGAGPHEGHLSDMRLVLSGFREGHYHHRRRQCTLSCLSSKPALDRPNIAPLS